MKAMALINRSQVVRTLLFTAAWMALVALPFPTVQGSPDPPAAGTTGAAKSAATATGPSFRNDVAPILVANCVGCHTQGRPGLTRGKLDLTTFSNLMEGTPEEKVIMPQKPDESHLVLRVRGEETPRMPQGGNNNGLAEEAIGKIEEWIKAGARLDAGLDPKAPIETYAASPDQVRRNQLARISPKDRDQKTESVGRDRWKQTNPKLTPAITSGDHFVLFSNLPKDRAANVIKVAEAQQGQLKRLLGGPATDWVEKVGLYVFNDRKDFVEFARTIENREVDASTSSSGHLSGPQPYIVLVDPLVGKKDEPAAVSRRRPRGRRGETKEASAQPDRTLAGLLGETLGEAAVAAQGKPPRWLAYGVGASLSSQVEPRSPYYQKLRDLAREKYGQGWPSKAAEALDEGDQVSAEEIRAIGFAMVEFLMSPEFRGAFPAFVQGMSKGKEKLNEVLKQVYRADREEFLNQSGSWVALHYGQDQ
jgi:mono/diheme cytochrome c family protein